MTKDQFAQALLWAKSDAPAREDPSLMGCGEPDFKPVWTTLEGVAELLRWQCKYLMIRRRLGEVVTPDDWWDSEALQQMWHIARHRFLVPDTDRICSQVLAQALEGKCQ
jgi:hypothetical protein